MNAYRQMPRRPRGPVVFGRRSNFWILAVALVATLELAGTLAVPSAAGAGPGAPGSASIAPASPANVPSAITTHGDLDVAAGKTVYIPSAQAPRGVTTYYQGGNISVAAGGTLIVQNTTLSFVQFIGDTGVPAARLSHVFRIVNHGTIIFRNSTLTTATFQVNPYPKLTVLDDGVLSFWNSTVRTAGNFEVGAGGDLSFNGSSALQPNSVASLTELPTDYKSEAADFRFAPSLEVTGGGQASFFGSSYTGLYSNNFSRNGSLVVAPFYAPSVPVTNGENWTTFLSPTEALSVLRDYLYPAGVSGGNITFAYNDSSAIVGTNAYVKVFYGGVGYGVGFTSFLAGTNGTLALNLPQNLTANITAGGMEEWMNRSGAFGTPSDLSVRFHVTAGPNVPGVNVTFNLLPLLSYGPSVSGAGSKFTTINSFVDLNFSTPIKPIWTYHPLTVSGGATAFLANLTIEGSLQNNSPQYSRSAVEVSGAGSNAYLYRWAQVSLVGKNKVQPVPNATLTENYAYGLPQKDNTTAATANDIKAADPALAGYLAYLESSQGSGGYGKSNAHGVASLLLASNDIYATSQPDGDFLGDYHITITPPDGLAGTRVFNASVPAFPIGVAAGSPGYGQATSWGTFQIPGYYSQAAVAPHNGVVITANGVKTDTIRIGQTLGVAVTVVSTGTAPVTQLDGTLVYNASAEPPTVIGTVAPEHVDLGPGGAANATVKFTWLVNETVVGAQGKAITSPLGFSVNWNLAEPVRGGGTFTGKQNVTFAPSFVNITSITSTQPTCLNAGNTCDTHAVVTFNGTGSAQVILTAFPVGGGTAVQLGVVYTSISAGNVQSSSVSFSWDASDLSAGKTYTLTVSASYNGVSTHKAFATQYTVPGAPSSTNLWSKKILGEPLWLWLVIAALVVVAIIAFLFVSRRQAAGKLVECGECGNLIPEDAKVCPKCGAEFESDVVRCSRCSSTIPADSKFCPECAAQLLGKPGEGGLDPERQAYADFTERFRAEAKKELGENYSEGAFWDWWKRQGSYTPFSQWKLQQGQGTSRSGMSAPPSGKPPAGGAAASGGAPKPKPRAVRPAATPPPEQPAAAAAAPATAAPAAAAPAEAAPSGNLKPCPNCGKEIPPEYLVCPFCGSVTQ